MNTLMAIDPGPVQSAYVVIDVTDCRPVEFGKIDNADMIQKVYDFYGPTHIEMIASYGMPVGAEVFTTCLWIGRYIQAALEYYGREPQLVYRKPIALHHCGSPRANDANITRALVDRFTPGQPNYGKGTKAAPGWFHGFKADVWASYALAVYVADTRFIHTLADMLEATT